MIILVILCLTFGCSKQIPSDVAQHIFGGFSELLLEKNYRVSSCQQIFKNPKYYSKENLEFCQQSMDIKAALQNCNVKFKNHKMKNIEFLVATCPVSWNKNSPKAMNSMWIVILPQPYIHLLTGAETMYYYMDNYEDMLTNVKGDIPADLKRAQIAFKELKERLRLRGITNPKKWFKNNEFFIALSICQFSDEKCIYETPFAAIYTHRYQPSTVFENIDKITYRSFLQSINLRDMIIK